MLNSKFSSKKVNRYLKYYHCSKEFGNGKLILYEILANITKYFNNTDDIQCLETNELMDKLRDCCVYIFIYVLFLYICLYHRCNKYECIVF